jgi:hypothetical protein
MTDEDEDEDERFVSYQQASSFHPLSFIPHAFSVISVSSVAKKKLSEVGAIDVL